MRGPSEIDREEYRAYVSAFLALSSFQFSGVYPLDAVFFNATAIYKRRGRWRGTRHRRKFPPTDPRERRPIPPLFSFAFPRFYLPYEVARGYSRMDLAHQPAQTHGLSPALERFICTRAERLSPYNEKHSSCCSRLLLPANFLLQHRHVQIACIYLTCIISARLLRNVLRNATMYLYRNFDSIESDNRGVSNKGKERRVSEIQLNKLESRKKFWEVPRTEIKKKKRQLLILLTKNRYLFYYSRITSLDCTPQHFFAAR